MIGRRAGGNNCAGDPDISRGVTMRAGAAGAGPCPPPAVAAETLPAGGDRQHGLRPSPAGRSAIPTARTHSHRCRRPPHLPNHHRASPAAGCAAIPSVAPQRSPRGRRDRVAGRGPGRWAVGSGNGQSESPSSAAPRPGLLHVMTLWRTNAGIEKKQQSEIKLPVLPSWRSYS